MSETKPIAIRLKKKAVFEVTVIISGIKGKDIQEAVKTMKEDLFVAGSCAGSINYDYQSKRPRLLSLGNVK